MRYPIEPRERRHVKSYGFYILLEILVHMQLRVAKNISNKYSQKLVDTAKKICNICNKDCLKRSNSKNSRSNGRFSW